MAKRALVAILMGSDSDFPVMREAARALEDLGVDYKVGILSAHRTPEEMGEFARTARKQGFRALIAGAGGAAHLPGMLAAQTELPVIGVPVALGTLGGEDALLSIVQMPKGVPVATVAINGAYNAGVLAAQIVGALDEVARLKRGMRRAVLAKRLAGVPARRRL